MSRNFELLQEIGGDKDLFATPGPLPELAVALEEPVEEEPLRGPDRKTREAILQNASLPSVFETSDVLAKAKETARAEQRPVPNPPPAPSPAPAPIKDSGSKSSMDFPIDDVFASFGNLTSPVDFASIFPEFSAKKVLQEAGWKDDGSKSKKDPPPSSPRPAATRETPRTTMPPAPRPARQRRIFEVHWADAVKAAAHRLTQQLHKERKLPEVELEAITREEECKLSQRVFPGTGMDSPRVAVFSGLGGDGGAAAVCARMGELLAARSEGPVCVIDANFDSPSLHRRFGTENSKGLAEAILERGPLTQYVREVQGPGLCFMPNGRTSLLLSAADIADRFRTRLAEARGSFWYVVIHTGFLGLDSTAMLISRSTDGVVLVVEANRTKRESAKRVKENISAAKVGLLGVVLNNRTFPIPKAIYQML